MRLGFVGLGNLGAPLAANLLRAGFELTVCDLDPRRAGPLLDDGARWAGTARAVAEASDTVITCLPSPAAVAAVVEGGDGVLGGLAEGGAWIDTSTTDRRETARLAALAAGRGIATLEAPVTGGVHLAASGGITVIVAGDPEVFEAHRPVLAALGEPVFYLGALGSAAALKAITNLLALVHLVALGEALMLAKRADLDLAQAFGVMRASSGTSFVLETEGQLILNGSYDVGFAIDLALKDLGLAEELARDRGVPLELGPVARRTFERARERYGGDAPSTMAVKLLEDALGTDLRAPGFPARLGASAGPK